MSLDIVQLEKKHLLQIDVQDFQSSVDFTDSDYVDTLLNYGKSYAFIKNNVILGACGFIEETEDRACLWTILSKNINHNMISIHRAIKRGIENASYNRVYARVHKHFSKGIIWVKLLGMEFEGIERQFIKGHDYAIFSKIKGL